MADKLTAKQSAFIQEYMIDLNATQAAIRAGYSEDTAQQMGSENLSKPLIAAAIEKALQERAERTLVTADMVIEGLLIEAKNTGDDASHSARVAAWAHLAKHKGMFIERTFNTNRNYTISDEPLDEGDWAAAHETDD